MKRFTEKTALLVTAAALCAGFLSGCAKSFPATGDEDIISFLSDNGICADIGYTVKEIVIPAEFGDVYTRYNELQISQGFDLSGYKSKEAKVYTFPVISEDGEHRDNTEAHVIVCDDRIIGGDISSPAVGGSMKGIIG